MTATSRLCVACRTVLLQDGAQCPVCGTDLQSDENRFAAQVQEALGAELELLQPLGRGGMAVVYAAYDPVLKRMVAVKAMLPDSMSDPELVERFRREVQTAAQLRHPNIVGVYGVRQARDLTLMLMEMVEGRSVEAVLASEGPLALSIATRIASEVASALHFAHERGVVHRDVKPSNILLAEHGGSQLCDFGVAMRRDLVRLTAQGIVIGTMDYMSPEQRSGAELDARSDQYALGVTLFQMLAGRLPFIGSVMDTHRAHLLDKPPSVREFRPDVPPTLARAISRMLAKAPEERFPSMREARHVFEQMRFDRRAAAATIGDLSRGTRHGERARELLALREAQTMPLPDDERAAGRTSIRAASLRPDDR